MSWTPLSWFNVLSSIASLHKSRFFFLNYRQASILQRALQIGSKYQLAVYDSVFIALAEQLNVPLISVDERQVRAAIAQNVTIKPITDF
ncbi:MAG: type II toxin-antitoxin system VapC family toxin [Plectolyngbya sp. WJT66-NPBG17]|jgi:predicted nucleic acid-binding protein|nr:type II toxin-antitoxin system VapC family toxin [Plectolyngbya sp. WJT66-NPBG17]